MAVYTDRKRLNDAISICVVTGFYWFAVICRLVFYYLYGH
jgi:hypothetical protein